MVQDIVIIFAMSIPMLLFSVYPGIKAGDYFEEKYNIEESLKRKVMIVVTVLFTLTLSTLLHYL